MQNISGLYSQSTGLPPSDWKIIQALHFLCLDAVFFRCSDFYLFSFFFLETDDFDLDPMLYVALYLQTTLISTETHVPSPWYGQYRTHAHNHITRAVAAMDSCFALVGAHQHGIAVGLRSGSKPAHRNPLLPRRVHSTPLSASSTVGKWYSCWYGQYCTHTTGMVCVSQC